MQLYAWSFDKDRNHCTFPIVFLTVIIPTRYSENIVPIFNF